MKAKDVKVGATYIVKVSGVLCPVRIDRECPDVSVGRPGTYQYRHGGWLGTNLKTGRGVRIRSASKLRREATKPSGDDIVSRKAMHESTMYERRGHDETENYGGVLGADGQVYSDADPGL